MMENITKRAHTTFSELINGGYANMIGLFERLFGVQRLDPAIEECKKAIEEIEDFAELDLTIELYSLNPNEEDHKEIITIFNKYNLTSYEKNGILTTLHNNVLIVETFV